MVTPKKVRRRVSALSSKAKSTVQRIEEELPPELRPYLKRMRQGLARLEKQVVLAQESARRRGARLLREASHQLGRVEALGEREWRKRSIQARRDAVKLLRRLEKAIEPRSVARPRRKPAKRAVVPAPAPQVSRPAAAPRASALPTVAPASSLPATPTAGRL